MRATDIIRNVLDLIDAVDNTEQDDSITGEIEVQRVTGDDDAGRFRQIFDLLDKGEELPTANTPNEKYATVDAVTTLAGGGMNGPKHPADIRIKDPRGYE
jgi:ketosteroid isomerase-like protein